MPYRNKFCLFFSLILLLDVNTARANEEWEPLLVGLGSYCEAANILRDCGVRNAAFPFDWMLSSDCKKLIKSLDDDFFYFMDKKYLVPSKASNTVLLQTYYSMEFHHEGEWKGDSNYLTQNTEKLVEKYQRRVERFRQLKSFLGKVIFIRFANKYSLEPNIFYRIKENVKISEADSLMLYEALKRYFPQLDFYLIIVNINTGFEIELEKKLLDNLFMIKSNPVQPPAVKATLFRNLFADLKN